MPRILRDVDAEPDLLSGVTVGVVGFGNQGRAQAACLADAGHEVLVVARAGGPSERRARAEGFAVGGPADLARCAVIAVLVPDAAQPPVLDAQVQPNAPRRALLVFAHGFALRHGGVTLRSDVDVAIVGPLGPGALLRERWLAGAGLAGLLAVVQDATGACEARALAYASALRMTRAGILPTSLDEEVVSDLFAEQVVLTGGVPELVRAAWETLVEGGVSEEIAYYSCVQELKQIFDLVHAEGIAGMRERISATARFGGLTRGPRIVGESVRSEMRRILGEVKSGAFAEECLRERATGRVGETLARERDSRFEEAGRRVRGALTGGSAGRGVDSPGGET
ncbi:MAG: ketol-acid reductoisomerase [Candidatus Eiseniibacteriota bacterium]